MNERELLPCPPSLVGRKVEGPSKFPLGFLLYLLAGLALATLALAVRNGHVALLAAGPLWLALCFLVWPPRRFAMEFVPEGLRFLHPPLGLLAYRDIYLIAAPRRRGRLFEGHYPIYVCHAHGYVTIPKNTEVDSKTLYAFLLHQPWQRPALPTPSPELARYFRLQTNLFDPQDIWVFKTRTQALPSTNMHRAWSHVVGLMGTGLIWAVCGSLLFSSPGWIAGGVGLGICGFLVALGALLQRKVVVGGNACFIVGPGGCALSQGKLQGELKWPELHAVEVGRQNSFTYSNSPHGLMLKVAGANILVQDVYDHPLEVMKDLIDSFWDAWKGGKY